MKRRRPPTSHSRKAFLFPGQTTLGDSTEHIYPRCPAGDLWVKVSFAKGGRGDFDDGASLRGLLQSVKLDLGQE